VVAAICALDDTMIGVHRVYLRSDGTGLADIATPRAALGAVMGGAIRLAPVEDVVATGEIVVGVDIEEAAALGLLMQRPAWATATVQNLAGRDGIALPPEVRRVAIAAAGAGGAARSAWFRFRREGREIQTAAAPSYVELLKNRTIKGWAA
jgi:hypothetical protein